MVDAKHQIDILSEVTISQWKETVFIYEEVTVSELKNTNFRR